MVDQLGVTVDEIDLGTLSTSSGSSGVEVPIGEVASEAPIDTTIQSLDFSSPAFSLPVSVPSTGKVTPSGSGSGTALSDIDKVYSAVGQGCKSLDAVVKSTGLTREQCLAAANWLKTKKLIAEDSLVFCSFDGVKKMQAQIISCKNCFTV